MLDSELAIAIRATLLARLAARGITTEVKQAQQPTQQGVPTGPCVFLHKIIDTRHGWPQRADRWNETLDVMEHIESEQIESTYQFTALSPQDPANDAQLTPTDLLKAVAAALQSDAALAQLRAAGVGVLRVRDVRTGYSIGDDGEAEPNPSFDAVFTHRDTTIESVGAVNAREVNIHSV